jgi:hypothetical protein
MARMVYLVHGNNDGNLDVFSSSMKAAHAAIEYVTMNGGRPIVDGFVVSPGTVARMARVAQYVVVNQSPDAYSVATIESFEVR